MKMLSKLILAFLVSTTCAVSAAPTAEQARELVDRIIGWSLTGDSHQNPVQWTTINQHKADFQPDFYALMEWVSTPHPDASGRPWHYDLNVLWQLQMGSVSQLKVGKPRAEGDLQLVVVDYQVSSARESQPPSKFHNTWVVAEVNGQPVLEDIRYHVKHSRAVVDGSVAADMKKARAQFKAP
jgi:hypothetical protein